MLDVSCVFSIVTLCMCLWLIVSLYVAPNEIRNGARWGANLTTYRVATWGDLCAWLLYFRYLCCEIDMLWHQLLLTRSTFVKLDNMISLAKENYCKAN